MNLTAKRTAPLKQCMALVAILFVLSALLPQNAFSSSKPVTDAEKLAKGEVVVGLKNVGTTRYVTGTILLDQSPEQIWPVMVNPFEFQGKISPRMKTVEVMLDKEEKSRLRVTLDMGIFMPNFTYTVDSMYKKNERIDFKRVGGTLRDFSGSWEMKSADDGNKTELTYSMYIDPGFFVPQWIMREGVKVELPGTLTALRKRLNNVYDHQNALEPKTILAARGQLSASKHGHAGGVSEWQ